MCVCVSLCVKSNVAAKAKKMLLALYSFEAVHPTDLSLVKVRLLFTKMLKGCMALYGKLMPQLRSVTCHVGSHSVTCHPTQVNVPRLNPSHAGWYLIYRPRRNRRLS